MPIHMTHPDHGRTHAYSDSDVARLTALGWRQAEVEPKPEAESDPAPGPEKSARKPRAARQAEVE